MSKVFFGEYGNGFGGSSSFPFYYQGASKEGKCPDGSSYVEAAEKEEQEGDLPEEQEAVFLRGCL